MTQEDWNEVLYAGMEKKGPWSALYFVALMIFGNYILLNLLVAILVEGFINEVLTDPWGWLAGKASYSLLLFLEK